MFEKATIVITASTLIFSLLLFYLQNGEFLGSLAAALLATALVSGSYVIIVWVYRALRSKN